MLFKFGKQKNRKATEVSICAEECTEASHDSGVDLDFTPNATSSRDKSPGGPFFSGVAKVDAIEEAKSDRVSSRSVSG
jgi:hypothetical protein